MNRIAVAGIAAVAATVAAVKIMAEDSAASASKLPAVREMISARTDIWGDAAMRQANGASYDFFENLLPPLRWVNTDFRHYPIVLSAPRAPQKLRLVSNGSAINARANKPPMWYEQGIPISFYVGNEAEGFGAEVARLVEPEYLEGGLPVVTMKYRQGEAIYTQEVFAPVDQELAASGAGMVRFGVSGAKHGGWVEARIGAETSLHAKKRQLLDDDERCVVAFDGAWQWDEKLQKLVASLRNSETAELAIFTKPDQRHFAMSAAEFDRRKRRCVEAWQKLLGGGISLNTPEARVNNVWRSLVVGNYMTAVNDRLHYSAGNAYAKLYEGECGDVLRSILLFGRAEDAPAMLKPLLEFNRKETRFHVAGHKLQLLAYFYWLTRDAETVRKFEPLWRPSVELILDSRESQTGLLPKDRYAGDIAEQVYSLNSNANCWRGLRDVAAMLADVGGEKEAQPLRDVAAGYRDSILAAVAKSERLETKPPFIPVALLANEPAHDPLTATRKGSYYDLICPYIIGSEIFGQGSDRERWLIEYLQQHGGIAMGMVRTQPAEGQFKGEPGVNPLYGLRYELALLRRDDRERALVGFYGQLAQGMTRGTYIGGEGSRFVHGDENGRSFYLPPNSASNAAWLVTLRHLLIQDWDLDEDGKPETLRLLFGVPRSWLENGKKIAVANGPTMFGPVSMNIESRLNDGLVEMRVAPPPRTPKRVLVRAPLPVGWKVDSVEVDEQSQPVTEGDVVDITTKSKQTTLKFRVNRL